MLWPFLIACGLVLTVGCLSAFKNWTSLALVLSFALVTGAWWAMGEAQWNIMSTHVKVVADDMVLIVIFLKAETGHELTKGKFGWLWDLWLQLSWWDKAVLFLFPPAWITYVIPMSPVWAYWISWGAGILQLLAAGGEAAEHWLRDRARTKDDSPTDISLHRQGLRHEC